MKRLLQTLVFLCFIPTSYAVSLTKGTSTSVSIKINGSITDTIKCDFNVQPNQVVTIPDADYANLKTNEQIDASYPFMTTTSPKLSAASTAVLSSTLSSYAGYKESLPISITCDPGANDLVSFRIGALEGDNLGLFSGVVQKDLMLNFSLPTGQNLTDYKQIFRLATFLMVDSGSIKDAYRLDLSKLSTDPTNPSNLPSKIKIAPGLNSTFKLGFLLTKRSKDYDTGFQFNWNPPLQSVSYNASLPIILSFN